jgi:hypothetical protein
MAGIKDPILDICTKLREILVPNGEGQTVAPHVRIWNNQVKYEDKGELYDFPKPAFFIEVINSVSYQTIGMGMQAADIGVRIHIVHERLDAADGTFEQDLVIFDLRDKVRAKLNLYEPVACGPLTVVDEEQDYEHTNIYHYIVDFVCHFIDSKGSPLDANAGKFIDSVPPTDLELTVTLAEEIPGAPPAQHTHTYNIPK